MRKLSYIFLILITLSSIEGISQIGVAVICNPDKSFCYEVERVQLPNSNTWINACCNHFTMNNGWTCSSPDCNNSTNIPQGGYQNYSTFDNVPVSFTMPSGNGVWIFTDDELVSEPLNESSNEYQFLNEIEDYSFINESENEYVVVRIDDNTDAVIENIGVVFFRKKESSIESSNDNIKIYPNPATSGYEINVNIAKPASRIIVLNYQGKRIETNYIENGIGQYEISLPNSMSKGVYFLRVLTTDGQLNDQKF